MSVTRLPPGGEPESLDDLEELGDDAIIAQQTAAHAPQPRANVSEESRSVVISEHPLVRDTGARLPRSAGEPTLIIRDRRVLDQMRQQIVERQLRSKNRRSRAVYVWGALGLAAFLLGGIVAFLATDSHADAPSQVTDVPAAPGRAESLPARASTAASIGQTAPSAARAAPPAAVRLDELPVERKH